ncbi:hypothetical protein KO465_03755 [Candidatus Micrarchaeota archaeon]|nr:hypothetical protein [Candidatus Micrarchaeota archaeon]
MTHRKSVNVKEIVKRIIENKHTAQNFGKLKTDIALLSEEISSPKFGNEKFKLQTIIDECKKEIRKKRSQIAEYERIVIWESKDIDRLELKKMLSRQKNELVSMMEKIENAGPSATHIGKHEYDATVLIAKDIFRHLSLINREWEDAFSKTNILKVSELITERNIETIGLKRYYEQLGIAQADLASSSEKEKRLEQMREELDEIKKRLIKKETEEDMAGMIFQEMIASIEFSEEPSIKLKIQGNVREYNGDISWELPPLHEQIRYLLTIAAYCETYPQISESVFFRKIKQHIGVDITGSENKTYRIIRNGIVPSPECEKDTEEGSKTVRKAFVLEIKKYGNSDLYTLSLKTMTPDGNKIELIKPVMFYKINEEEKIGVCEGQQQLVLK